jgi:phospholipase C
LHAHGGVDTSAGSFIIDFRNTGGVAAVFQVRSGNSADGPRTYTVETHKKLSDIRSIAAIGASNYDL